jgi:hypothetical protein
MIDRKTLWILLTLALAMTAAALWRISLLPDWTQVPFMLGRDGPRTQHGLWFFVPPLLVLSMIPFTYVMKWLITGPREAAQAHHRMGAQMLVLASLLAAASQFFQISSSLGHDFGLNGEMMGRATIVVMALLIIVHGNYMPKLPWVSSRFPAANLDAWQQARSQRFSGRLSIVYGLVMLGAAAFLDMSAVPVLVMAITPLYLGAIFWHAHSLKREPSPLS